VACTLGDGDERHVVPVEHLDELGEVHERAAQPIDLVDDHDIDPLGLDIGQQPAQGWPLEGRTGDAAVVVVGGQLDPAF